MSKINWSGYEWLPREIWGQYHPDKAYCYYDKTAIDINDKDELILKTQYNPKIFKGKSLHYNSKLTELEIPIGVGLVSCKEKFGYGYFEIEAKLPTGKNLWPAFWMSPNNSWPPEIDVIEGYTKNKNNYFHFNWKNPFGFWRVETNFHCGEQPNNYNLGSKTHWLGFKSPSKNYNKFGCLWAEDKIEIYYNNRLVRKLTDDKLLDEYRGKTMNVKINTHVDKNIDTTNPTQSEYKIKYFKYDKLK